MSNVDDAARRRLQQGADALNRLPPPEAGDNYVYLPETEQLRVRHGVSEAEIDEAERARERMGYIGYVFRQRGNNQRPRRYDLIRLLGAGSYGRAYTATRGGRDREERYVIKEISSRPLSVSSSGNNDDIEYDISSVERELRMNKLVEERMGTNFCATRAICADRRFFSPQRQLGYILFPFYNAHTLNEYLGMIIYPRMKAFLRQKSSLGFGQQKTVSLVEIVAMVARGSVASEFVPQVRLDQLTAELYQIQTAVLGLSVKVLTTLALLHSKQIYHRDYKPENLLIGNNATTHDIELRVIDFGLACATPLDVSLTPAVVSGDDNDDLQFRERYSEFVVCPNTFVTTPAYRDPLAWYMRATTNAERREQNEKFDTYAVAKTILRLFTPTSYDTLGQALRFPKIKRTEFMPPGLYELLVTMTGEAGYVPAEVRRQVLTPDERAARMRAYEKRPSTRAALTDLLAVIRHWDTSG